MPRPRADLTPGALPDPFGTAELREATLSGWQSSPTRLEEDAAAEAELLEIGYRGRLFTELAANAADAAAAAGVLGCMAVWAEGPTVRIANTGAPLTVEGVRSLVALRVSPKRADPGATTVGRFGMGFRATSLAPRVTITSTSGAIEFDTARTRTAVAERMPSADPTVVPGQRLAWPSAATPTDGFDTEIVLEVGQESIAAALVADAAAQAADLLLELESIDRIDVAGQRYVRVDDADQVIVLRDDTELRRWIQARSDSTRWLVPVVDGRVLPLDRDVLRSPTATDIELTLPARLIAHLPLTSDRRDLHPSADVAAAAAGYPELVALVPDDQKQAVVPPPALAVGRVDAELREAVRAQLAIAQWVPSATGAALAPTRAWVLPGITVDLAEVLVEVLEPLAHPDVSDRVTASLLVGLGARQLGLADIAELLSGVQNRPEWWSRLYAALAALVPDGRAAEELGALPVPRADGRMHVGCRGLYLIDGLDALDHPPVPTWIPALEPAAYDPLLDRLGLTRISPAEAIDHPDLAAELDSVDDHHALADVVLRLLALPDAGPAPAALGALEIADADGDTRPADELLLPGSPLQSVLVDDSPFGEVAAATVETYGAVALRRLGVGWGFSVIRDPSPVAPDHDLPDEDLWWDSHEVPPDELSAVRDLDLVDPDRWPEAVRLLTDDPDTAPLLAGGYTRWWLRRYAEIGGVPLRRLRPIDDTGFRGLFDAVELPDSAAGLLAGDVPDDSADVEGWLAALADPDREIAPGVAVRAHAALVAALRSGVVRVSDVEPPAGVRTVAGTVSDDPIVVDAPWWTPVVAADRAVLPGLPTVRDDAELLADLLDATTASERFHALPDLDGEAVDPDSSEAVALLAAVGMAAPRQVRLHDDLHVSLTDDDATTRHRVPLWVADDGTIHLSRARIR
ncbi:hypothetical protein [Gordonia sp. (in: high G+C Gram-positive bacteria)]|uniref:sacsin N-terminal ATP-binding-like domain-containing protein n=1 Tax=Gordonia sp. (in: high G+C Gram-positive bacteria) TaxID=84139 RepID=UPI0016B35932|nr:hypothetical protein [Gordonia sp. (in: high G+C Gram-positive bacteria)]NLG46856.1 hypothetical protein [Gordonia sp. (in: high G+C Gram-positive bacteria)]